MEPIEAPPVGGDGELTSQILAGIQKYMQSIGANPATTAGAAGPQATVPDAQGITPLIPGS